MGHRGWRGARPMSPRGTGWWGVERPPGGDHTSGRRIRGRWSYAAGSPWYLARLEKETSQKIDLGGGHGAPNILRVDVNLVVMGEQHVSTPSGERSDVDEEHVVQGVLVETSRNKDKIASSLTEATWVRQSRKVLSKPSCKTCEEMWGKATTRGLEINQESNQKEVYVPLLRRTIFL